MTLTDAERQTFAAFYAAHARGEAAAAEYVDTHEKVVELVTSLGECSDPPLLRETLMQVYVDGYVLGWQDGTKESRT